MWVHAGLGWVILCPFRALGKENLIIKPIIVAGGINMDLIATAERMPRPGETVFATGIARVPGGKGLNQAIAAKRLGSGAVHMIGSVGEDPFGAELLEFMREEGIEAEAVSRADVPTGVALITVDAQAENTIVVAVGANSCLTPESLDSQAFLIADASVALAQLETPIGAVQRFLSMARDAGVATILNTAPARPLPDALISLVDILCLNETELAEMAGLAETTEERESLVAAAREMVARGAGCIIVTLGKAGALVVTADGDTLYPGVEADAVDPTGAGDCFLGGLAARLSEGTSLSEAVAFANRAASVSVQRSGASSSIPYREELGGV